MAKSNPSPVQLSFILSRSAVDHPDGTRLIVMVRVKTDRDPSFKRAPMNVSFVLDRSGSMQGDKLQQCKHAVNYAVSHLASQDMASIVLFDDRVDVLVPHDLVMAKDRLARALDSVQSRGSTNLGAGWQKGSEFVRSATAPGRVSRVLLLTDGQANAGIVQSQQLCGMARDLLAAGVQTTTIGFGTGFNEELLCGMATAGGGNFHYIETADQAPTIFAREFDELLRLVAQNARLTVAPSPGMQFLGSLQDFPTQKTAAGTVITLGDLCAGDEKNLLLEFCVPLQHADREVARLKMNFQQVAGDVVLREATTSVKLPKKGMPDVSRDPGVWREVLLAEVAREMVAAKKEADAGQLEVARKRIDQIRDKLESSDLRDDPTFKEQAAQLTRIRGQMVDRNAYTTTGSKSLTYSSVSLVGQKKYTQGGTLDSDTRQKLLSARVVSFILSDSLTHRPSSWPALPDASQTPRDVARFWSWVRHYRTPDSPERRALNAFSRRWPRTVLITGNETGLASALGMEVLELNGSIHQAACPQDGARFGLPQGVSWQNGQPVGPCGHPLVIGSRWAGHAPPSRVWDTALEVLQDSQAIIVLGQFDTELFKGPIMGCVTRLRFADTPVLAMVPGTPAKLFFANVHLDMDILAGLRVLAQETSTILP